MLDEVKRLGKHSLIYGVGIWVTSAVSFFMVPVYTRYLTPAEYGVLELLNRSLQVTLVIAALGLRTTVIRFYFEREDPEYRRQMAGSAMSLLLLLAAAVGAASLFAGSPLSRLLFGSASAAGLVQLMLLSGAAELGMLTPLALLQARMQSVLFTAAKSAQFLLAIGLNILFVIFLRRGLQGVMEATLLSTALPAAILVALNLRSDGLRFAPDVVKQMLRFGLPFVPAGLLGFVMTFSDRYLLNAYLDSRAVGIYSLGYKFGLLLTMLVFQPFARMWTPFQMEVLNRDDAPRVFARVLTYLLGIAVCFGLGISVLARDVIRVVSDAAYLDASLVVPLIVLSQIFWGASLVFDGSIYITKKTAYKPLLLGAAAAVSVILNIILIRRLGVMGAAWATLAYNAFFAALTWAVANRLYAIPYEFARVARLLVVAGGLYAASTLVAGPQALHVLARTCIALSFPFALAAVRFYRPDELAWLFRRRQAPRRDAAQPELAEVELQETV